MGHDHDHGHHRHDHSRDPHGNPEDLRGYIAKLEDPARDEWQKPDAVIKALELGPGQVVCDAGAGPGYFALKLALHCHHVFACEVEPQILGVLRERLSSSGRRNVTPVLALPMDPLLPPASCDRILVANTFHHFANGPAYLKTLARLLRPGGRIANIDFYRRDTPVGPPVDHRVAREDFLRQVGAAGLRVTAEHDFLPHQYFLVLEP